jgi:hypothetical protein
LWDGKKSIVVCGIKRGGIHRYDWVDVDVDVAVVDDVVVDVVVAVDVDVVVDVDVDGL